jgi:hypothetical protein
LLGGALGGAATAQWIVAPWVRSGRTGEMLSVFSNIPQVMPSVSANGHNLWWLKLPGGALSVLDWNPVGGIGPWDAPPLLTFATLGRLGFGLLALLPLLRVTGPLRVRLALAAAGYTAYAYFMTITQVHENHLFAALPFLAAAAALDFWLLAPFAIASVCFLGNLALHDFLIGDWVTAHVATWLPWHEPVAIQTANAALNVAGFALFTVIFLRRPFVPRQTAGELRLRARLVLVAGVAIAGSALAGVLAVVRNGTLAQRVWERLVAGAANVGPIEAKLGHKTPLGDLLARAAVDYANLLYTLAGVAAAVGAWAALAGAWWRLCAWHAGRWRENVRTVRPTRAGRTATTATIDVAGVRPARRHP